MRLFTLADISVDEWNQEIPQTTLILMDCVEYATN